MVVNMHVARNLTCWMFLGGYIVGLVALFFFVDVISLVYSKTTGTVTKEYLVHINSPEDVSSLKLNAERFGLHYGEQLSPNVHSFIEGTELDNTSVVSPNKTSIVDFQDFFKSAIHEVQPVYYSRLKQFRHNFVSEPSTFEHVIKKRALSRQCSSYYGMEIEKAWTLNFTGAGVNVAILDVGVETDHPDLKPNIKKELGFNFVNRDRRHDLRPDYDASYQEVSTSADHGTNIAGLIAAVKGNDLCCRGVAYDASIVPLVVFHLEWIILGFNDRYIPKALDHKKQEIHIYSNSYNNRQPFSEPKLSMQDSLITGVTKGRGSKGSIFVFSLGDNADNIHDGNQDYYANSIHTVTIGAVGKGGLVPEYTIPCACIIASTLSEGKTKDANQFLTTSHRRSCTNTFKGSSAAAGIGAAIIALGLHDRLSWRDVQYLLVLTSSLEGLTPILQSTVNAFGLKYNPHFGYGLMNATAFALTATTWNPVPTQIASKHHMNELVKLISKPKSEMMHVQYARVEVRACDSNSPVPCVHFIEHVIANIHYTATRERLISIQLCSPSKTCSVLLHDALNVRTSKKIARRTWNFTSVQFWGESPEGDWSFIMTQYSRTTNKTYMHFAVRDVTLFVYGTSVDPFKHNTQIKPKHALNQANDSEDTTSILDIIRSPEERDNVFTAVLEGDTGSIIGDTDETGWHAIYFLALIVILFPICIMLYLPIKNCIKKYTCARNDHANYHHAGDEGDQ